MPADKTIPTTISGQDLAALLMITPRRVQQLAQAGVIPKSGRGAYPLERAVQAYLTWLDDEARRAAQTAAAVRVADARAEVIQQKIGEKRRGLIPVEDYRGVIATLLRTVRAEVDKVPAALPVYIRDRVRVEIDRSLATIAKAAADAQKKVEAGKDVY